MQILYDGFDITNTVINYERDQAICSGVGSAKVTVDRVKFLATPGVTLAPYKVLTITDGTSGQYYLHTYDTNLPDEQLSLSCQDGSLKLQEYFISDTYDTADAETYSGYWIKLFLNLAGVSYSFIGSDVGTVLSNNTTLGMCSAMDAITPLLQQSGWYIYFNSTNTAVIGQVQKNLGNPDHTFVGNQIRSINITEDDKNFRNRAIVWGNTDKLGNQVFADIDLSGRFPNEYDQNGVDKRTVVLMSSNIPSNTVAAGIASRILNEFTVTTNKYEVELIGERDVSIGDVVRVVAVMHDGVVDHTGVVTTATVNYSSSEVITRIILGEKCPRLFSFFSNDKEYIYVGTKGAGVWRKVLNDPADYLWTNFSTGLTDLYIKELEVYDGVFACVTEGGHFFTRTLYTNWAEVPTPNGGTPSDLQGYTCCEISPLGVPIGGYYTTLSGEDNYQSWTVSHSPGGTTYSYPVMDTEGSTGYKITSMDENTASQLICATVSFSGLNMLWNSDDAISYSGINTDAYLYSGWQTGGVITPGLMDVSFFDESFHPSSGIYERILQSGSYYAQPSGAGGVVGYSTEAINTVFGDGRYVGFIQSRYNVNSTTTYQSLITTTASGMADYNDFTVTTPGNLSSPVINLVGNNTTVIPYYDTANQIKFKCLDHLTSEVTDITSNYYGDILATAFQITPFGRKFYTLIKATADTDQLTLLICDIDLKIVYIGAVGTFASFHGANTYGFSANKFPYTLKGACTGTRVFFLISCFVEEIAGGWGLEEIPLTIEFNGSYALSIQAGAAEIAFNGGGWYAVDNLSWNYFGAQSSYVFVCFHYYIYGGSDAYVISRTTGGSTTAIFSGLDELVFGVISGVNKIYFLSSNIAKTLITVRDFSGTSVKTFTKNKDDLLFVAQPDDLTNAILYFELSTKKLYYVDISGSNDHSYTINLTPSFDTIYGNAPTFNRELSSANLVHDCIYISVVTSTVSFSTTYIRRAASILIPLTSERSTPENFTRYQPSRPKILKRGTYDHTESTISGAFHVTKEAYTPLKIEADKAGGTSHVLFGGTVYSGIGGTGYNTGAMYVSPIGDENTFSSIILNNLSGYVDDARYFSYLIDANENTDQKIFGDFIIFPQPTSTVITSGTGTNLTLVSIPPAAQLGASGVGSTIIVASGSMSAGYVLETFPSEYLNCVETTNTPEYPYIFASVSGAVKFYQKNGYLAGESATVFEDQTYNLPAEITVIRCDDLI